MNLSIVYVAAYVSGSLLTSPDDAVFNSWCKDCGIICPKAEMRTTSLSVSGRGVFSTDNLTAGEVVISIPYYMALTQDNGARYFPDLAAKLLGCRQKSQSPMKRLWNRILTLKSAQSKFTNDDFWQAELSAYALTALATNHPWSTWISQWKRNDPFQNLVDSSSWRSDIDEISNASLDFVQKAPEISKYKIRAAMELRLAELNEYVKHYKNEVPCSESLYTTLCSRAIGLSNSVTACLPMHDMINHSHQPNLAFTFNDGIIELVALDNIAKDSELFLSYMDVTSNDGLWDEDKATWMLVQWGIPSSPCNF